MIKGLQQWQAQNKKRLPAAQQRFKQAREELERDEKYLRYINTAAEVYEVLKSNLPDTAKPFLFHYYCIVLSVYTLQEEYYYRRGFMDGVRYAKRRRGFEC